MKVTGVNVKLINKKDKEKRNRLQAICTIFFDNDFAVHGVKIICGERGDFIAFPSVPKKNGEGFMDIAHPINQKTRKMIEEEILKSYQTELDTKNKEEHDEVERDI
ncbi:SpoVG family protein [Candidatus Phytoplasma melaleucae]|uniref:Septation protein SpoVG family protein n=1 Tax=Candidatus Phytoplasma melaleucae TaxID=2982630 RepID=A0ABT9DD05_9MOLU|nr:SpoVG family protein ['Melaleuca sp.' phytoplasma]MDO8167983.1 septation protein SpoVG family protein ['Melaleuca sp.' phytoplasma]MDV3205383.1 SpoVG family protein [Weeping tea tree witches'-broom phytoplasma]